MALAEGAFDTFQTLTVGFYQFTKPHVHFTYVLRQFGDGDTHVVQVFENEPLDLGHR